MGKDAALSVTKREPLWSRVGNSLWLAFTSKPIKQFTMPIGNGMTIWFTLEQPRGSDALNVCVVIAGPDSTRNVDNFTLDEFSAIEAAMRQTQLAARGLIDKPSPPADVPSRWERFWNWLRNAPKLHPTFSVSIPPFSISLRESNQTDVREVWMTFDGGLYTLVLDLDGLDELRGQARSIVQTRDVNLPG
jgi:hypothetical protein